MKPCRCIVVSPTVSFAHPPVQRRMCCKREGACRPLSFLSCSVCVLLRSFPVSAGSAMLGSRGAESAERGSAAAAAARGTVVTSARRCVVALSPAHHTSRAVTDAEARQRKGRHCRCDGPPRHTDATLRATAITSERSGSHEARNAPAGQRWRQTHARAHSKAASSALAGAARGRVHGRELRCREEGPQREGTVGSGSGGNCTEHETTRQKQTARDDVRHNPLAIDASAGWTSGDRAHAITRMALRPSHWSGGCCVRADLSVSQSSPIHIARWPPLSLR